MTQGWAALGKPDYATCALFISRLPERERNKLTGPMKEVLQWMIFYLWSTGHRTGGRSVYALCSQLHIAAKIGKSRWTVMRALVKLRCWGMVTFRRRDPKPSGQCQTNIYFPGRRLTSFLATLAHRLSPSRPCASLLHNKSPNEYKGEKTAASSGFASHSLSLSASKLRERNDWWAKTKEKWDRENAEIPETRGQLSALFAHALAKPSPPGGLP